MLDQMTRLTEAEISMRRLFSSEGGYNAWLAWKRHQDYREKAARLQAAAEARRKHVLPCPYKRP